MFSRRNVLRFKLVLAAILTLGFNNAYALDTYEYRFNLSGPSLEDCKLYAVIVAERFKEATGKEVLQSFCTKMSVYENVISISYLSENELLPYSATFGFFPRENRNLWRVFRGMYSTIKECMEALPQLSAVYENETKLKRVAAYCFPGALGGYGASVDGFGTPANFFTNTDHALEFAGETTPEWAQTVAQILENVGARTVHVGYFGNHLAAHFFSSNTVPVASHLIAGVGGHSSAVNCNLALHGITEFFKTSNPAGVCLQDSQKGLFFANLLFVNEVPKYWTQTGPSYETLETCLNDKERIIELVGRNEKRRAQLAICSLDQAINAYRMTLIGAIE